METPQGMIDRVRLMGRPDTDWDLSENDTAAIRYVLGEAAKYREVAAERDQLRAEVDRLRGLLCAECGGTGEVESGICYCGNDYNSHTVGDGHAPVDCPQQCGTCAKKERMVELRGAYRELQRIVGEDCGIVLAGDLPHVCRETLEERITELQQEEKAICS